MDEITLTDGLLRQGFRHEEILRLCGSGALQRVRRGAYARPVDGEVTPQDTHRRLVRATAPQLRADAVFSHTSAAVLHGLPVWPARLPVVHLTRPRQGGGGKSRSLVRIHSSPLAEADRTEIDGLPVTSLARTVLDLARSLPFDEAVAAGDRALATGLALDLLVEMLDTRERWAGMRQARRVAGFIDSRAESTGESVSRVRCFELGLPAPDLQVPLFDDNGQFVARGDLGWQEQRTIGEFDGKIKYGRLLKPGQTVDDVVFEEKRREDRIRDLGWQVVRWIWAELYRFGVVRERLDRAFARTRRPTVIA